MLAPVKRLFAAAPLCLSLACVRVEAGTDPEPLGYGPGPQASLAAGYDPDPAPRPAPTPWTPPVSELAFVFDFEDAAAPADEPVPYNDDLVRVCEQLSSFTGDAERCLQRYRIERVFRTIAQWKTLAACLEAASDVAAVDACERATPRAFAPIAAYPRESEVCMHIFAITIVEQLGAEPMLELDRLVEFEQLLRECVDSLVDDERADRTPSEYAQMLECIERARTTGAAEACE